MCQAFVPGLSSTSWKADQYSPVVGAVCLPVCQLLKCRLFSKFLLLCWSSTTPNQHPPSPTGRAPPPQPHHSGSADQLQQAQDQFLERYWINVTAANTHIEARSSINISAAKRGSGVDDSQAWLRHTVALGGKKNPGRGERQEHKIIRMARLCLGNMGTIAARRERRSDRQGRCWMSNAPHCWRKWNYRSGNFAEM